MIKPGHPHKQATGHHRRTTPQRGPDLGIYEQSRKETIHLNQRNHPRDTPNQATTTTRATAASQTHPADEDNLASTFGTLLSSQGTDAHPQPHHLRSRLIGGNSSSLGPPGPSRQVRRELGDLFRRSTSGVAGRGIRSNGACSRCVPRGPGETLRLFPDLCALLQEERHRQEWTGTTDMILYREPRSERAVQCERTVVLPWMAASAGPATSRCPFLPAVRPRRL